MDYCFFAILSQQGWFGELGLSYIGSSGHRKRYLFLWCVRVCMFVWSHLFWTFHMYWINESLSRFNTGCLKKNNTTTTQNYSLFKFDKQKFPAVILSISPNTLCSVWNWFPLVCKVLIVMPGLSSLSSWYLVWFYPHLAHFRVFFQEKTDIIFREKKHSSFSHLQFFKRFIVNALPKFSWMLILKYQLYIFIDISQIFISYGW